MRTRVYVDLAGDGSVSDAGVEWWRDDTFSQAPEEAFFASPSILKCSPQSIFVLVLDVARSQPGLPFPDLGSGATFGQTIYGDDLETF